MYPTIFCLIKSVSFAVVTRQKVTGELAPLLVAFATALTPRGPESKVITSHAKDYK